MPRFLAAIICCFLFLSVSLAAEQEFFCGKSIQQGTWKGQKIEYVEGEIIVGLKDFAKLNMLTEVFSELGVVPAGEKDKLGILLLEAKASKDIFQVIEQLQANDAVRFAEPNMIMRLFDLPNDFYFQRQWGLNNTGQSPPGGTNDADIDAPEAWNFTYGISQIMIGVLDTGIPIINGQLSHPDLDDPARYILGPGIVPDSLPRDDNGHGTHVTGIIAAETNNGYGIAGVAGGCRIMAIKVFSVSGIASDYTVYQGMLYAVDNGCRVINFSGGGGYSTAMEEGVAYADSNNVVCCFAAGNDGHGPVSYPAALSVNYDNVLAVSSTDHNDQSSQFSSIGPEVTVAAPGGYGHPFDEDDIYSTMPDYPTYLSINENLPENYAYLCGTSMACPHVAGLAGLILSMNPSLTAAEVRDLITSSADDLGPAGFDDEFGYGRINCYNALLEMGELNIGHSSLPDSKDSAQAYRVDCAIFTLSPLVQDSLLLHYNAGSGWSQIPLTLSKEVDYYYAYIPPQHPGTTVSYYLTAKNTNGAHDSAGLYQFSIIDYQLFLEPIELSRTKSAPDTVWYTITITNDGVYEEDFNLAVSGNKWNTSIWKSINYHPIDSTGYLVPDEEFTFRVKVEIPESYNGESDTAIVIASSKMKPEEKDSTICITTSYGMPLNFPFYENFTSSTPDIATWVYNRGAEVDGDGISEPSEPYALHLNGYPLMGDTITSQIINTVSGWMRLDYFYQRTGGGESPDIGDDLFVEYLNDDEEWILLNQHYGSGEDMTEFQRVSVGLPDDCHHDEFRIRFRNTASNGERDDWFVDNISVQSAPFVYFLVPEPLEATLAPNETASKFINISKPTNGLLIYEVNIEEDYSLEKLFKDLQANGKVEPPSRTYPSDYYEASVQKGDIDYRNGSDVINDAGGPDQFGYIWLDSDDPNGPDFAWIDISETGTSVEGLSDDSYAGPIPIGFDFEFYGETYSEVYISSNGIVGFGPPDNYSALVNGPIPDADVPNNFIALLWDDLNIQDSYNPGAEIKYQLVDGKMVISYLNMPEYMADPGDVFTGQVILNPDGSILLQYLSIGSGFEEEECSIGIEDGGGLDGLEVVFNHNYLKNNLAVLITQQGVNWLTAIPQQGSFLGPSGQIELVFNSNGYWSDSLKAVVTVNTNYPNPAFNPFVDTAWLYVVPPYYYGDANSDKKVNISDAVMILNYIFIGGSPPDPWEAGDANCDSAVNVSDAVTIINYIFNSTPIPCEAD